MLLHAFMDFFFSQSYIPEAEVQHQNNKAEECFTQELDPNQLPEEPQTSELHIQMNSLLIT